MFDAELYTRAGNILKIAMGKVSVKRGQKSRLEWRAEQDPLAFVCGIEAIIALSHRASLKETVS